MGLEADNDQDSGERSELYGTLSLIGTTGLTLALGIIGFFLAGLYISRKYELGIAPVIIGVAVGVFLSFFWVYYRLTKHLGKKP